MTELHWVDKYLIPLNACPQAVVKARQYADPQAAWDAWDNGEELLWTFRKTGCDKRKMILCACDFSERVLHIFETKYPNDARPRQAIEAARRYAENPTEENRAAARVAAYAAYITAMLYPNSNKTNVLMPYITDTRRQ